MAKYLGQQNYSIRVTAIQLGQQTHGDRVTVTELQHRVTAILYHQSASQLRHQG